MMPGWWTCQDHVQLDLCFTFQKQLFCICTLNQSLQVCSARVTEYLFLQRPPSAICTSVGVLVLAR